MRAVDRVDDPAALLVGGAIAVFLGQHAMRGVSLGNPFPQLQLDGSVGLGHEGSIGFAIHPRGLAEVAHGDSVRGIGELEGEGRDLRALTHDRIRSPVGS